MTAEPVELNELLPTRERLFAKLQSGLDINERNFLLSLVHAEPDWSLPGVEHVGRLPGIRWKYRTCRSWQNKSEEVSPAGRGTDAPTLSVVRMALSVQFGKFTVMPLPTP